MLGKKSTFKLKYKIRIYDSSPFSQYVYNDGVDVCFKYTGSGDSRIIVPEGMTKVIGFSVETFKLNYDTTYVYLPSTLESMRTLNMFNQEQFGYDTNLYSCLYQCPNIKKDEGGNYAYQCNGSSVVRPGDIIVWSVNEKIPHDLQKYIDYNNRGK